MPIQWQKITVNINLRQWPKFKPIHKAAGDAEDGQYVSLRGSAANSNHQ